MSENMTLGEQIAIVEDARATMQRAAAFLLENCAQNAHPDDVAHWQAIVDCDSLSDLITLLRKTSK